MKAYLEEVLGDAIRRFPRDLVREVCGDALARAHRVGYRFEDCPCVDCVAARSTPRDPGGMS